jgi:hypothetical protein
VFESERVDPGDPKPQGNVGQKGKVVFVVTTEKVPRKFYISYHDIQEHGGTPRCKGCYNVLRGMSNPGHSQECRLRFEELLKNKDKVKKAKKRREDFEEKEMSKRSRLEEERKKKQEEGESGQDKKEGERPQTQKRGHEDEEAEASKDRKREMEVRESGKRKGGDREGMGDGERAKMKREGVSGDSGHPLPGVDVRRSSGSNGESGPREVSAGAEVEEDVMTGIVEWINEVIADMGDESEMPEEIGEAWDDVKGGELPVITSSSTSAPALTSLGPLSPLLPEDLLTSTPGNGCPESPDTPSLFIFALSPSPIPSRSPPFLLPLSLTSISLLRSLEASASSSSCPLFCVCGLSPSFLSCPLSPSSCFFFLSSSNLLLFDISFSSKSSLLFLAFLTLSLFFSSSSNLNLHSCECPGFDIPLNTL